MFRRLTVWRRERARRWRHRGSRHWWGRCCTRAKLLGNVVRGWFQPLTKALGPMLTHLGFVGSAGRLHTAVTLQIHSALGVPLSEGGEGGRASRGPCSPIVGTEAGPGRKTGLTPGQRCGWAGAASGGCVSGASARLAVCGSAKVTDGSRVLIRSHRQAGYVDFSFH